MERDEQQEKWLRAIQQCTPQERDRRKDSIEEDSTRLTIERGGLTDGEPSSLSW